MTLKNQSVDKITENVYRFAGGHTGGPGIARGSVVLTTDSQKRGAP